MKHLSEEELVLLYYGEPGVSGEHLRECAVCRAASESLAATLNLCNDWKVPEPPADFTRTVWAQLAPQLWESRFRFSVPWQLACAALAMALMLVIAFTAGRATKPSVTAGLSKQARERILEISVADHLDRAGMLLTEISNVRYLRAEEFSIEKTRAQDLVEEGRLMRQMLGVSGTNSTVSLLDELERCMLEVANSPDQITPKQIDELQQRVAATSLIFKTKIIEANLRTEGQRI